MSIYLKQIADVTFDDLRELQNENAQENVRLEFKRKFPTKNEVLKKISSMANTYGGYLIIGAEEDGKGNLVALDGVPTIRGGKQKLIEWCYGDIYPPIMPFVKEIPHTTDTNQAFFIVYVEESFQAPHFINDRKGCYIRIDEISKRFEPRLATYQELRFLMDRREKAINLRNEIVERAHSRFERNTLVNYGKQLRYHSTMSLAITPRFPGPFSLEVNNLSKAIHDSQLRARGGISFPGTEFKSAIESFYHSDPRTGMAVAYFEANIHGLLYFGQGLVDRTNPEARKKLLSTRVFGWLYFYLRYAALFYRNAGYDGSLHIQIHFDQIEGMKFVLVHPDLIRAEEGKELAAEVDDAIHISTKTDTKVLQGGLGAFMQDLVRQISFAFGWADAFSVDDVVIGNYIQPAREYLDLWDEG